MNHFDQSFLQSTVIELVHDNFGVLLENKKKVADVGGYFSGDSRELAVAINKPFKEWFPVYIHEYNHYKQWYFNVPVWQEDGGEFLDWMENGNEYSERDLIKYKNNAQLLELDCEKRTVNMIRQFKLSPNIDLYIKKANSYIFYYNVLIKTRKWLTSSPYAIPEIVDMMSSKFLKDGEYLKENKKYEKLVMEHCA